jgi:hypothetical protein
MSFDLPASVELQLELYAQAEHITPVEAALRFIRNGLDAKGVMALPSELTETQMEQLRSSPTAIFFGGLSDHTLEQMEQASTQIHSERFTSRG